MSQLMYTVDLALRTDIDGSIVRQEVVEVRADDEADAIKRATSIAEDWLEYDVRIQPRLDVLGIEWSTPVVINLQEVQVGGFLAGWWGKPRVNEYPLNTVFRSAWWDAYDQGSRVESAARHAAIAAYMKEVADKPSR